MNTYFKSVGQEFDSSTVDKYLPFTQSTPYFLWKKEYGCDGIRFVAESEKGSKFFSQFFVYKVGRLSILYSPLGPIIKSKLNEKEINSFLELMSDVAKEGKHSFVRLHLNDGFKSLRKSKGYTKHSSFMQPQYDRFIKLKDEEILFSSMSTGTRKIIKKAELDLSLEIAQVRKDSIDSFMELLSDTAKRQSIKLYDTNYYEGIFKLAAQNSNLMDLLFATYNNKRIATALIVKNGKNATYLFGGTSEEGLSKGAQYFLQWSAIKKAKQEGMGIYSFGGASKNLDDKQDRLYNISIFKKKFGGEIRDYGSAYDLVNNNIEYTMYNFYKLFKR